MAGPVAPTYTGTRASQITQYAAWLNSVFPKKISGASDKALNGKSWGQYYTTVADNPKAAAYSPRQLAESVQFIAGIGEAPAAIDTAITGAGVALGDVATGIQTASILPGWADPLATLLGYLTSEATWLRVAKIAVGSVMVIVGLLHLTGADKAVTTAAKGALL